ncbi:unnamed protein product [Rangifer tarandus platyrhynchus]|uniref:Uncharacterized protein n=1 Tax=Rangifer tarandus platyrhynchus TaxID=3082113 RepID=A0ABN8Y5J6_RANTA|nr:unnamed protein product [Rangifer tarandus platyrhynchus]
MLHSSLLAGKVSPGLCRKGLGGDSESNRPDQTGLCARLPGPGAQTKPHKHTEALCSCRVPHVPPASTRLLTKPNDSAMRG